MVNDAVMLALQEDLEDIQAIKEREHEPTLTLEVMLKELRRDGKL